MSKIRVIDLLNKIANGEGVPKNISFEGYNYMYHEDYEGYYRSVSDSNWVGLTTDFQILDILNKFICIEVEEQQDIDIQGLEDIKDVFIENSSCGEDVKYLARKYNELVQAVKQLDKNIKDKE